MRTSVTQPTSEREADAGASALAELCDAEDSVKRIGCHLPGRLVMSLISDSDRYAACINLSQIHAFLYSTACASCSLVPQSGRDCPGPENLLDLPFSRREVKHMLHVI